MRSTRRLLLALASLTLVGPATAQNTWYVDVNGTPPGDGSQGNPYTSLQYCFGQPLTQDGDVVLVLPGTYDEDLDLAGKSLDLRSTAGAAQTVLRPATGGSVLRIFGIATARMEAFTIRDGFGSFDGANTRGGGVYCNSSGLELVGCVLTDNHAGIGGNLYIEAGSDVVLTDCTVTEGNAYRGGGLHIEHSQLLATSTAFHANHADPVNGGATMQRRGIGLQVLDGATIELYGCQITDNTPGADVGFVGGGMYYNFATSGLLQDCVVSGNGATGTFSSDAGGIAAVPSLLLVRTTIVDNRALYQAGGIAGGVLRDCDVLGNRANTGGGTFGSELEDCRVIGNRTLTTGGSCGGPGGGAYKGTLTRCLIEGNQSYVSGGGAHDATLVDCQVIDNAVLPGGPCTFPLGGGGLFEGSATGCEFRGNRVEITGPGLMGAAAGGGAAYASLTDCLFDGNAIDASSFTSPYGVRGGGAAFCSVSQCTFVDNSIVGLSGSAAPEGGGIYGSASDSVLVGNSVETVGGGPAVAVGGGAAMGSLTRCVVADNYAERGGGAWQCDLAQCTVTANWAAVAGGGLSLHPGAGGGVWGSAVVRDTILWGNFPDDPEVGAGSLTAEWSDLGFAWPGTGNFSADPLFWSEEANDHHLRPGSPCIDAGDPNAPTDPDGSIRDVGARTYDPTYVGGPYLYCEAKTSSQGCTPAIGWSGTPTLSGPDDFFLEASALTGQQTGLFFWGSASADVPFFGGTRCVANPLVRTPASVTGGSGAACSGSLSFHLSQAYLTGQGLFAGDRVFAQCWFRDPTHPDGTGVGLSDALDFTLLP